MLIALAIVFAVVIFFVVLRVFVGLVRWLLENLIVIFFYGMIIGAIIFVIQHLA